MKKSVLASLGLAVVLTAAGAVDVAVSAQSPAHQSNVASQHVSKVKTITISMLTFAPGKLKVAPGAKIKVVNMDGFAHTVTSDDGTSFDNPIAGKSTIVFNAPMTPGKYKYHCTIHSTMHGLLVVKG